MKKIRKILPFSIYDIPGIEHWLEEQANNGLFPTRLDAWATFTPNAVPGTRFRLEPYGEAGKAPSQEQLLLYREAGWEYAFPVGTAYFLFYTTDPAAVELYSDFESRGLSIACLEHRIKKYQRVRYATFFLIAAGFVWALFFLQSKFDVQPDRFARIPLLVIRLFSPTFLILLLSALFIWWQRRRDYQILNKTCRALKEGLPPPNSPGPRRGIVWENRAILILLPILLLSLIFSLINTYGHTAKPLEEFSRPHITLQKLEQEEVVSSQALFGLSERHEEENTAQHHFSLLAPVWYETTQTAYATAEGDYHGFSPNPETDYYRALRYTPSLDAMYLRLLIPALARPVAKAQLDTYRLVNLHWQYEERVVPGLDFVILASASDSVWQMAAIGKGSRVAVFRYGGREDLREHLDDLASILE